jgi:hypothetical protein
MLIEAVERKIIDKDPADKLGKLLNDRRRIKIITPQEFKKLFVGDWRRVTSTVTGTQKLKTSIMFRFL